MDGFRVYNKYMNFNFIKSLYYLICLSINLLLKNKCCIFFCYISRRLYFLRFILKKKYLSNYTGDNHQLFSNKKNIPLVGGIFLVIPIISINYNNIFYYFNNIIIF